MGEILTKETYQELVKDSGGLTEFTYALWQKAERIHKEVLDLRDRVDDIEEKVFEEDDDETAYQLAHIPAEEHREQMLGDLSTSYPWHLLHRDCWSWPQVRALREKIIADANEARVFNARPDQTEQSVISAIHRNSAFRGYREWVWRETGGTTEDKRMIAGLDPWAYLEGLKILAGPAEDGAYKNAFVEIHLKGGSR
jgi:hypothetical protein